ncbi:MAG: hypothetical protein D6766_13345 [Verrucomicrobia bacterium]|nr:MAG: hypothetical protein D6766_13345 [Verrucomicrobiota bacterium]
MRESLTMRKYTTSETIIANVPYVVMVLLGAVTLAYTGGWSAWRFAGVVGYLAYGIVGAVWIMVFVCPYCQYYASTGCPCGYGMISARIVTKGDRDCFVEKFRRHIFAIVPLWIIPVVCGGIALWRSFSWPLVGLVLAFVGEAWVVLPIVSKKHGCAECPQKEQCPWMARGAKDAQHRPA